MHRVINPLNAELNPIRHLLALVGARHIVHVSRIRVNMLIRTRRPVLATVPLSAVLRRQRNISAILVISSYSTSQGIEHKFNWGTDLKHPS